MASKSRVSPVLFPAIAVAMVVLLVASAVAPSHGARPAACAAGDNEGPGVTITVPASVAHTLQALANAFQN